MSNFCKSLTIVVPTFNHPKYIDYFLEKIGNIDCYDVMLEIHDSSTNDDTEKIVCEYLKKYKNLVYKKYDDIHVDIKTILALTSIKTKYVHLCGDGVIPNLAKIYKACINYIIQDYDIIEIYDSQNKKHISQYHKNQKQRGKGDIIYSELLDYVDDNIWHLPYYGGTIIKSDIFSKYNIENLKDVINSGFVYPYMILKGIPINFKAVALGDDFLIPNIYKKQSLWISNNKIAILLWAKNFPETMWKTAKISTDKFQGIMISAEKKLKFLTFKGLLSFRSTDNFNFKIRKQYKYYLKQYGCCNSIFMFFICLIPKKILCLAKIIKKGIHL